MSQTSVSQSPAILLALALIGITNCTGNIEDTYEVPVSFPAFQDPGKARCDEPIAVDHDPDPNVVEVHLRASKTSWNPGGGALNGMAYNDCVPGPLIVAELGNTLRVVFENALTKETTVHWHGLRVPNDMDGTGAVQDPVAPGESFTYSFELKDAGLYWYHPHIAVDLQVEQGLQGAIWVRSPESPTINTSVIVLDDILHGSNGDIAPPSTGMDAMAGRYGDQLLVSGQEQTSIAIAPNAWMLLAFVNTANTRFFKLELEEHDMLLVGTDGGFLNTPIPIAPLLLAPGERALVLIRATGEPGARYRLRNRAHTISPMGNRFDPIEDNIAILDLIYGMEAVDDQEVPSFPADSLTPIDVGMPLHTWVIEGTRGDTMGFTIDGQTYPNVPPLRANMGNTTFVVQINSMMAHPFHFHGERFQIVGADYLSWKDTFIVPANTSVTIVSSLSNPGDWMYHCHILEHEEAGMMGVFTVRP